MQALEAVPPEAAEWADELKNSSSFGGAGEVAEKFAKIPQAASLCIPTLIDKARTDTFFTGKVDNKTYPTREACTAAVTDISKGLMKYPGATAAPAVADLVKLDLFEIYEINMEDEQNWPGRAAACWAIGMKREAATQEEVNLLVKVIQVEKDPVVVEYAQEAMERLPKATLLSAIEPLASAEMLESEEGRNKPNAIWALACKLQATAEPDVTPIIEALGDGDPDVRKIACLSLAKFPQAAAVSVPEIHKLWLDKHHEFFSDTYPVREARVVALTKLAEAGSQEAKEALE